MRHILPISGKDSLWTAIVQKRRNPDLTYEAMFNPTGAETPEVDAWLDQASAYIGLTIHRIGENLEAIIEEKGILPSPMVRYCTREAKIHPMENWLGKDEACIYYGIRADEKRSGYNNAARPNLHPIYPLIECGMGIDDVWIGLDNVGLLPPAFFWQSLYDLTKQILGVYADVLERIDPLTSRKLFAGRSRMNCSFCFFQRAYEWIWLLETHPDLYQKAVEIEANTGAANYTWRRRESLPELASKSVAIKRRRAKKIASLLLPQQTDMFEDDEEDIPDLLQVVSCGLFCGK